MTSIAHLPHSQIPYAVVYPNGVLHYAIAITVADSVAGPFLLSDVLGLAMRAECLYRDPSSIYLMGEERQVSFELTSEFVKAFRDVMGKHAMLCDLVDFLRDWRKWFGKNYETSTENVPGGLMARLTVKKIAVVENVTPAASDSGAKLYAELLEASREIRELKAKIAAIDEKLLFLERESLAIREQQTVARAKMTDLICAQRAKLTAHEIEF